jgi:hypothetical protein
VLAVTNSAQRGRIYEGRVCLAIGFEVLTAVAMKSSVFWDITPGDPAKVNRRRKVNQVRNQREAGSKRSDMLLRNVGGHSPDYSALYQRRRKSLDVDDTERECYGISGYRRDILFLLPYSVIMR